MPVVHLPMALPQLIALVFVVACFGSFALTLLAVSLSVTRAERQPPQRSVIPARRDKTAAGA